MANPAQGEIDELVSLFNQERHSELEILVRGLTGRFPLHGFCWMVLGAVLGAQGRSADALAPLQKATQLLPMDAQAHNNLGTAFFSLGQLTQAAACYSRALEINPKFADADKNLDLVRKKHAQRSAAESDAGIHSVTNQPLVSILIPSYNSQHFEFALKSAIGQSYEYTEIVVSDDCQSDEIEKIVQRYSSVESLRYVKNRLVAILSG